MTDQPPFALPAIPASETAVCRFSPDCVKVLDQAGHIVFFNEDGLRLMDIEESAAPIGIYWPMLWPEESRPLLEEALAAARKSGVATFSAACPTAKGESKWWEVTVVAVPGPELRFAVVSRDVTDSRAGLLADGLRLDRLQAIMGSNSDVLWDIDLRTGKVWWGEGMGQTFGYGADEIGDTTQWCHEHIHPEDRERVAASMEAAVADGSSIWEAEFRYLTAAGIYLDVYDRGAIIRDIRGTALRFVGVMQDVSARKAAADRQQLVAGELSHRINNVLAVVTALFRQSAGSAEGVDGLVDAFGGRLLAMASANTAILRGGGEGASLSELARLQLAPFLGAGRLTVEGPDVTVPQAFAQPLALALNELATNALKYGALSGGEGRVSLQWTLREGEGEARLGLSWIEAGGPEVREPARSGLGSALIEQGIPSAQVERSFHPAGFECRIELEF